MRHYVVLVKVKSVEVREAHKPIKVVDARAIVDNEKIVYQYKKHNSVPAANTHWRERAQLEAYYHARNIGVHVKWIPSPHKSVKKRSPVAKQLEIPF